MKRSLAIALVTALPLAVSAQTTISQVVDADTYVSSGQPTVNFGSMGAMEIAAPTAAQNRTEETLLGYNTASVEAGFDAQYGAGNWAVTGVTLTFFSNVSSAGSQPGNSSFNKIAAGDFELDWLSNNNWNETTATWNSLPGLLPGTGGNSEDSLGDFYWPATGAASSTWSIALDPNMASEITSGGNVTIFGQPTAGSTVGYLYNQQLLNASYLNVTAEAIPEPNTMALFISGLAGATALRCRKILG